MASEAEIAWAAGLFEGEGCWGVYPRKNGSTMILVKLATTDRDVLDRFHGIVGCGAIQAPRIDTRANRKPIHTWAVYEAVEVSRLIRSFFPWMGERRLQKALEVLAVAEKAAPAPEKRTHCPHGHAYLGRNLGLSNETRGGTTRYCKTCRAAYKRRVRSSA